MEPLARSWLIMVSLCTILHGQGIVIVVVVVDVDFQLFTDGMAPKFVLTPLSHVSTLSTVAHP